MDNEIFRKLLGGNGVIELQIPVVVLWIKYSADCLISDVQFEYLLVCIKIALYMYMKKV